MEETTVSIIGIFIAAIMMFIVPLILIADRSDDISQLTVQTLTAEFVDEVVKSGKITDDTYTKYISSLSSTGNIYEIDMEIKILDENTAKRLTVAEDGSVEPGKNTYYSIFTSQVEDIIGVSGSITNNNREGKILLKHGDAISVTVKNISKTLSQSLKSFYYKINGDNSQIIAATASGTIVIDGQTFQEWLYI